jgi:hypothetical protein
LILRFAALHVTSDQITLRALPADFIPDFFSALLRAYRNRNPSAYQRRHGLTLHGKRPLGKLRTAEKAPGRYFG